GHKILAERFCFRSPDSSMRVVNCYLISLAFLVSAVQAGFFIDAQKEDEFGSEKEALEHLRKAEFELKGDPVESAGIGENLSVTDEDFRAIGQLKNLKRLSIVSCADVAGVGLRHLKNLKNLTSLSLHQSSGISDDAIKYVGGLVASTK